MAIQSNLPGASPQPSDVDHISLTRHINWIRKNADQINCELETNAVQDPFFAYLLLSFHENFNPWIKEKLDIEGIKKLYPDSPIIQYKLSLVPKIDADRLKEMLLAYPDFHEINFFLGGWPISTPVSGILQMNFCVRSKKIIRRWNQPDSTQRPVGFIP